MAPNNKADRLAPGAASNTASVTRDSNTPDRLNGWHALGAFAKQQQATKPSQSKRRPPMRGVKS